MQIVDNSGGISSGSANITIPGLEKLKDLLTKFNSDTTPKKPLNTHAELYKNILPKEQQTEFILSKKPQNTIDKSDNTIPKKSKNSVLNIEFKPDETDEYKFTPSEFEAALVYNEIGYSRYADKNGNIYIEVMTSYLSAPLNNYDYRYNIYKYDKDGKFIGTAKDVKESDALLFHPINSKEYHKRAFGYNREYWSYEPFDSDNHIKKCVFDNSKIEYKGEKFNLGFKPDETDDYKFTLKEFEKSLAFNNLGYDKITGNDGNVYIKVETSYMSRPGSTYDERYNIYKYDKDGKFSGLAEDVSDADIERYLSPIGFKSERINSKYTEEKDVWIFEKVDPENYIDKHILNTSLIEYKGDQPKDDAVIDEKTGFFSRMSHAAKIRRAKNELLDMEDFRHCQILSAEDAAKVAEYYLKDPQNVVDALNGWAVDGMSMADLAILNVISNGDAAKFAELQRRDARFDGDDIRLLTDLNKKTNGLAMEFANIHARIFTDEDKHCSHVQYKSAKSVEYLCKLGEQYGNELVLNYAKINHLDRFSTNGDRVTTYDSLYIARLLKLGETYGHDVIYELALKTGYCPEMIKDFADLNVSSDGVLLELLSGDYECNYLSGLTISNFETEDWKKLTDAASKNEENKQSIKELLAYRDKNGRVKFSKDNILYFVENNLYPQFKDNLTVFVELSNDSPRDSVFWNYNQKFVEAFLKHKKAVIELADIDFGTGGYNTPKGFTADEIAEIAEAVSHDRCFYRTGHSTVDMIFKKFFNIDGKRYKLKEYGNYSLSSVKKEVIQLIKLLQETNYDTFRRVINEHGNFIIDNQYIDCIKAYTKNYEVADKLYMAEFGLHNITERLVDMYEKYPDDVLKLHSENVSERNIYYYLNEKNGCLYQNNKEVFDELFKLKVDKNSITANLVETYKKDPIHVKKLLSYPGIRYRHDVITEDFVKQYSEKESEYDAILIRLADKELSFYSSDFKKLLESNVYIFNKTDVLTLIDMGYTIGGATNPDNIENLKASGIVGCKLLRNYDCLMSNKMTQIVKSTGCSNLAFANTLKNLEKEMLEKPALFVQDKTLSPDVMRRDIVRFLSSTDTVQYIYVFAAIYNYGTLYNIMLQNAKNPKLVDNLIEVFNFDEQDIKEMSISEKIRMLETIQSIPKEFLNPMLEIEGNNLQNKISELKTQLGEIKDVVTISEDSKKMLFKNVLGNNNSDAENVFKTFDFAQYGKSGLPLEYSREEFTNNIENIIKNQSEKEQQQILDHFGFERGASGFDGILNDKPFECENGSAELFDAAQKVQQEIVKFTTMNKVKTGDKKADEVLTSLVQGIPEFSNITGKVQHGTHIYSVDIHSLKVLQSAMNNPLYNELDDIDKLILKLSAICHDFGKRGGIIDSGHASKSAEYAEALIDRYKINEMYKDRIIDIIENHHWFEAYCRGKINAKDVAIRCRRPEDFIIYEILAKADFENVNETMHLERSNGAKTQAEFENYMADKMNEIDEVLDYIYSNANLVFDTKFAQNGDKFPRETVMIDDEPAVLKVLNLNKLNDDDSLFPYGFPYGTTKKSSRYTVHMTDTKYENLETVYVLTTNSLNESSWSTSVIKPSDNDTYWDKKYGFIYDVDQANIAEAYKSNIGSGYEKKLDDFKDIIFERKSLERTYVRDEIVKRLSEKGIELDNNEYAKLVKYLLKKRYLTQITKDIKIGDKIIKASDLVEVLEKSREMLFSGSSHNEMVVLNPRIIGLIAKVNSIEECPKSFLKFAYKYDLPIILMNPTDK